MSFLRCNPMVSVIGDEYEILITANDNGISKAIVGDQVYYEENSGVLSSEKAFSKIRVPQTALNEARKYTVVYKKTIERKGYFSEFGQEQTADFEFKPLDKTDNINIYHVADVHYNFDVALKTTAWFGDDLDVLIVNGDIGEVESEQNYFEVCKFVGDVTGGKIPVIFVRGNHDTRGHLAERFTDYFPCDGKNTYFTFNLGCLCGVALDCGEDKWDNHPEYGGANAFEAFRRRETEFLRKMELPKDKICFAISHVCPAQTAQEKDSIFNIDKELYEEWNALLAQKGIRFMICGHMHRAYVLKKNDQRSIRPHDFPVVTGSAVYGDGELWGCAMTIKGGKLDVLFTDNFGKERERHQIDIATGNVD